MGPYGTPQVDRVRFPDMKGMVSKAHGLGLRAGWCECRPLGGARALVLTLRPLLDMGNYQCSGANNQCNNGGKRGNISLGANCSSWDMPRLVEGSVKALVEVKS